MSDINYKARSAGKWQIRRARTLLHIGGQSPVCEISISAKHVHEDMPGDKARYIARQEANAAFIVTAVNAHDDLVAVLKSVVGVFEGQEDVPRYVQKARAALASLPAPQVRGRRGVTPLGEESRVAA